MKNILVIKAQDRGGSYFIKNELLPTLQQKGRENWIYDINGEYNMFHNALFDHFRELPEIEEFLDAVPHDTDSYVNAVFEEATGFFSKAGNGSRRTMRHVTRRHHTKNVNVFVFHNILAVPEYIRIHMDFWVLFRTDDNPAEVRKEYRDFPKVIEAFNDVQEKTAYTYFNREKKIYANEHSKKFFHYKRIVSK